MSLIKCCECNNEVSEYAEKCPNCGCPINKIKESVLLSDETKLVCKINDKYVDITWIKNELQSLDDDKLDYYKFYCSPEMDDIKIRSKHFSDQYFIDAVDFSAKVYRYLDLTPNPADDFLYQLIESDFTLESFNGESLSEFNQKQSTMLASKPKCPMCGSTNISKIGSLNRAASIAGFGILSRKIGKQWQCNNPKCRHLW